MADDKEIKGLIALLQGLYSRLAEAVLGMRQGTQRKGHASGSEADLSALLSRQVDQLVQASDGSGAEGRAPGRILESEVEGTGEPPSSSHESRVQQEGEEETSCGELGSHFHESEVDHFVHSSVGDKIKHRVLQHVNNALRNARIGDRKAAKMSLEIARASLAEASHYMEEEEYRAFAEEVKAQLRKYSD
jgi:hypothetical protein